MTHLEWIHDKHLLRTDRWAEEDAAGDALDPYVPANDGGMQ